MKFRKMALVVGWCPHLSSWFSPLPLRLGNLGSATNADVSFLKITKHKNYAFTSFGMEN